MLTVLDLFSGLGGFSLGLTRSGFRTVAFCEIEKYPQSILRKHWPGVPIFDDIRNLHATDLPEAVGVICGGFPCQPWSVAEKLRSAMQGDTEKGIFHIETYTKEQWTDTSEYLSNWLEAIKPSVSLATYRNYKTSITKHLTPFFQRHRIRLKEIQYDVLMMLLNSIDLTGQGKICVMKCMQICMKHAWRSQHIPNMPPFPDRKMYRIETPEIKWISEDRQMAIMDAIPERHRPIFLWLKYHLRWPAEAMSLLKTDYDPGTNSFTIHRSVSSHKQVDRTKTGKVHVKKIIPIRKVG